jgi:membrane-bound metal-dependent hydrolase YbcI (DUF457 family)
LVLGTVAALGFTAWHMRESPLAHAAAIGLLAGLVAVVGATGGLLATAIVALFVIAGLGIVRVARWSDVGPVSVLSAALLGLLSHPFGDLFTGAPPRLFYPLDATLVAERVTLHPDPTLHLLSAFFLELATIWVAVLVYAHLRGWQPGSLVRPRATLGVGYAGAVFAIPDPTLQVSSPFVFSVLAVGLVGVPLRPRVSGRRGWTILVTALTAVTIAATAYTAAYLVV